jgi:hypothetical protein
MPSTDYAAVWQEGGGPVIAGRLRLDANGLSFEGAVDGRTVSRSIAYETITASRLGRETVDRVGGRPALVIELSDGETIRVATLELGALHELRAELIVRG